MRGFDPIKLEWEGETFSVPSDRQMELIYRVEMGLLEGQTGQAFEVLLRPGGPPLAAFCRVYASALRYAGSDASDLEVFRAVTDSINSGDGQLMSKAIRDVLGILNVLALDDDQDEPKKARPAKKPKAPAR